MDVSQARISLWHAGMPAKLASCAAQEALSPITSLRLRNDSLRPEDEYADRDDMGLEPVVSGSQDPKVREKEAFGKYFKMLIIFIPLTLGVNVSATVSAWVCTRQAGLVLCLWHLRSEQVRARWRGDHGSQVPLRAKIPAWLCLPGSDSAASRCEKKDEKSEVWAVGMTRSSLSMLANAARSGARLGRPDQQIYRIMGPQYKAPCLFFLLLL